MRCLDSITDSMDISLGKLGNSGRTEKPGVLQSMKLQRFRHTEQFKCTHLERHLTRFASHHLLSFPHSIALGRWLWCGYQSIKELHLSQYRKQNLWERDKGVTKLFLSFSLSLHLSICSLPVFLFPFSSLEGKKVLEWRLEEHLLWTCAAKFKYIISFKQWSRPAS